jgi:hypothetical protein
MRAPRTACPPERVTRPTNRPAPVRNGSVIVLSEPESAEKRRFATSTGAT